VGPGPSAGTGSPAAGVPSAGRAAPSGGAGSPPPAASREWCRLLLLPCLLRLLFFSSLPSESSACRLTRAPRRHALPAENWSSEGMHRPSAGQGMCARRRRARLSSKPEQRREPGALRPRRLPQRTGGLRARPGHPAPAHRLDPWRLFFLSFSFASPSARSPRSRRSFLSLCVRFVAFFSASSAARSSARRRAFSSRRSRAAAAHSWYSASRSSRGTCAGAARARARGSTRVPRAALPAGARASARGRRCRPAPQATWGIPARGVRQACRGRPRIGAVAGRSPQNPTYPTIPQH